MKSLLALAFVLLTAAPAFAQTSDEASAVEDIVVTARRIEAPLWEVRRGDAVLILVGSIDGLPRDMEWRTDALVSAVDRADRVLFPPQAQGSLADVGRLIWRMRTLTRLPDNRTSADYLSPELEARVEQATGEGPSRNSMMLLSADLMERGGYARRARPVSDLVRRAARTNRTPAEPVSVFRAAELVDRVLTTPPERYLDCIAAAVAAAEIGEAEGAKRAEAWRTRRIPAVLASPLEKATNACSYWAVMEQGEALRSLWNTAANEALSRDGVTFAIVPLVVLAESDGVLDRLERDGLEPVGPDWRAPAP